MFSFRSQCVLLFLACGLVTRSLATTCSSSINPCSTTLRVTNQCSDANCVCTDASTYIPVVTGCAERSALGEATVDAGDYSGEVVTGEVIQLTCSLKTEPAGTTYEWYNGEVKVDGQTSVTYSHTAVANEDINIKCKALNSGLESESQDFNVKTVDASAGVYTMKPQVVVVGGFTKVVTGNQIPLKCINIPVVDGVVAYVWTNDPGVVGTISVNAVGTDHTCAVTNGGAATSGASDAITAPTAEAANVLITALEIYSPDLVSPHTIKEGTGSVTLNCRPTDTEVLFQNTDIASISWTRNDTPIASETQLVLTLDTSTLEVGTHTIICKGTPTGGSELSSPSFTLIVSDSKIEAVKVIVPSEELMAGNYLAVRCLVSAPSLADITFSWKHATDLIIGQTDHTLQIYEISQDNAGEYTCTAEYSGYSVEGTLSAVKIGAVNDNALKPKVTSNKPDSESFGEGDAYTLTCENPDKESVGLAYKWFEDTVAKDGETSKTLSITATSASINYACQITFGGTDTQTSVVFPVQGKVFKNIELSGVDNPVVGTSPTYTCAVTLSASGGSVTYEILKGTDVVASTASHTFASIDTTSSGAYKCKATVNEVAMESIEKTISPVVNPETPIISGTATTIGGTSYPNKEGTYTYTCDSKSVNSDTTVTVEWKFTPTVGTESTLSETSTTYKIDKITTDQSGNYTCKVTVDSKASIVSSEHTIEVGETFGKRCTAANFGSQCTQDFTKYTGNCVNSRCECYGDTATTQDGCGESSGKTEDDGTSVTASLLTMLFAAVVGTLAL